MATQNIVITVSQTGAQGTGQAIAGIGASAQKSQGYVEGLQFALKALASTLAINQLKEWSDVWTRATGLVNIFSKSQNETNLVLQKLYEIAQNTRQSLEGTVKAYHQMTIAGAQLAASQDDMLKVTNLLNQAFAIQATPTNVAKAAILQLSHSFTEGIVRGRQFNSLLIEAPRVLQVAADHIDAAQGSVGKLRQIMLDGNLTSKAFFEALVKGSGDLQDMFDKTGKTFGQAFTILENAAIKYVGQLTQANGVSTAFYNITKLVADNMDILAKSLLAVASPFILNGLLSVAGALRSITIWAAANPFTALLTAITVATTALILFKDQIVLVQDEGLTLGDYMSAVGTTLQQVFAIDGPKWVDTLRRSFEGLQQFGKDIVGTLNNVKQFFTGADAVNNNADQTSRYNQFQKLLEQKQELEAAINDRKGGILGKDPLGYLLGDSVDDLQKQLNDTITLMQKAQDAQKRVELGAPAESNSLDTSGRSASGNLMAQLTAQAKIRRDARVKEQAEELKAQQEAQKQLSVPLGPGADFSHQGKTAKEPKNPLDNPYKLQQAYTALLNKIQPLAGALEEYKNAQEILNREEANGTITTERKVQLLDLVTNHYRDILDPIGAYTRNLERENQFLQLNAEDRQVAQKLYQQEEALRKQGITVTDEVISKMKEEIETNQELARVAQIRDGIYKGIVDTSRQYSDQLSAIAQLQKDPSVSQKDITSQVVTKGPNADLFEGTQEALQAQQQQYDEMYKYIDGLQQQSVISAQTSSVARIRVFQQEQQTTLQGYSNFFGVLAQLRTGDGKRGSKIAKAAAIAQATINTYTSATGAYASASAIPFIGWVLGPIAAAAAIAAGLANVAAIKNQSDGFKEGGYTGNLGVNQVAGQVHGQEYVMDAATTARIGVHNLDDLRSGAQNIGSDGSTMTPIVNVAPAQLNVAVVSSREAAMAALRSSEGEQFIIETVANNPNAVRLNS